MHCASGVRVCPVGFFFLPHPCDCRHSASTNSSSSCSASITFDRGVLPLQLLQVTEVVILVLTLRLGSLPRARVGFWPDKSGQVDLRAKPC